MVRRAVCGAVVVLVASTVVAFAAAPARADGDDPVGAFDAVSIRGPYYGSNVWEAQGWAADPNAADQPFIHSVTVHLYLDGVGLTDPGDALDPLPPRTGDPRPDVATAVPFAGQNSGWHVRLLIRDFSPHTLCAYAINVGAGTENTTLGCISFAPGTPDAANPVGVVDEMTVSQGLVRLQGWFGDPDAGAFRSVHGRLYQDGTVLAGFEANHPRPDVEAAFPDLRTVGGFDESIPIRPGLHIFCIDIDNIGYGADNTSLGCSLVDVPDAQPPDDGDARGAWDSMDLRPADASQPAHLHLTGWAWDPKTAPPYHVHVRSLMQSPFGGGPVATVNDVSTGEPRPDVQQVFADAPADTGWSFDYGLPPEGTAPSIVCVYVTDGMTDRLIGCSG